MSADLINSLGDVRSYLPWVSFLAGIGGSLHCVGMCGGLVTATCEKSRDVLRYQIGRLCGYLILGVFAGFLGSFLDFREVHPSLTLIPAFLIGILFIFWGLQSYRGKRAELPTPSFMSDLYIKLWRNLVQGNRNFTKAFFTGLISIFLPCGLLYGVVLGAVALQHSYEALLSMFFFWLGTVPSMMIAPQIVQRLIRPFKSRLPKTYAVSLMLIGLLTIIMRMTNVYQTGPNVKVQTNHTMSCH